jgi:hypothetical protein
MAVFSVGNNTPPPPTLNVHANSTLYELDQTDPSAPPGSIGHQISPISGQLTKGNPGGAGQNFGLGLSQDSVA